MDPFEKRNAPRSIPTCVGLSMSSVPCSAWIERSIPTCVGSMPVAGERAPRSWRSIPTCVGSIPIGVRAATSCRSIPTCVGSIRCGALTSVPVRSIPTCVGSITSGRGGATTRSVHPHVRGEHRARPVDAWTTVGPSPRAWGSMWQRRSADARRSIPTCGAHGSAGSSRPAAVHPHVRGEQDQDAEGDRPLERSIPTCVGLTIAPAGRRCRRRSIPTCVGSRTIRWCASPSTRVHPHVRGEHPADRAGVSRRLGPSPRAWGSRSDPAIERESARSIPTCVGSMPQRPGTSPYPGPSPRAWGAWVYHEFCSQSRHGPSPRAWGASRRE